MADGHVPGAHGYAPHFTRMAGSFGELRLLVRVTRRRALLAITYALPPNQLQGDDDKNGTRCAVRGARFLLMLIGRPYRADFGLSIPDRVSLLSLERHRPRSMGGRPRRGGMGSGAQTRAGRRALAHSCRPRRLDAGEFRPLQHRRKVSAPVPQTRLPFGPSPRRWARSTLRTGLLAYAETVDDITTPDTVLIVLRGAPVAVNRSQPSNGGIVAIRGRVRVEPHRN